MKVVDEVQWAQQEMELRQDETSVKFHDFLVAWFTEAETTWDDQTTAMDWVRAALVVTEERLGYIAMEWIGQMLVVACQHWIYGDLLLEEMTPLERRMYEQMAAVKLVELQESAKL
jgi:hypothetical protein